LTAKIRLDAVSLTLPLLKSKSFHMVCAPSRAIQIVTETHTRIDHELKGDEEPVWIWEPVPDLCTPEELGKTKEAAKLVDVISPNHQELAGIVGLAAIKEDESVDRNGVQQMASIFVQSGIGRNSKGAIVVRCGKEGCYFASRAENGWLPAYHQSSEKVVDPTGGGNTFLGGLAIALARNQRLKDACIWATISASFAIEQIGMPVVTQDKIGEKWNGASVSTRLDEFVSRLNL
jgi:sugar/nucleoside kinase (ribokinase family)